MDDARHWSSCRFRIARKIDYRYIGRRLSARSRCYRVQVSLCATQQRARGSSSQLRPRAAVSSRQGFPLSTSIFSGSRSTPAALSPREPRQSCVVHPPPCTSSEDVVRGIEMRGSITSRREHFSVAYFLPQSPSSLRFSSMRLNRSRTLDDAKLRESTSTPYVSAPSESRRALWRWEQARRRRRQEL